MVRDQMNTEINPHVAAYRRLLIQFAPLVAHRK